MTIIIKKFTNSMSYSSLYGFILMLYENNAIPRGDEIYLYNQDTNVVYLFDYRVYYTKIGYLLPDKNYLDPKNYKCFSIPNESYQHMPGRTSVYARTTIMTALQQPKSYYFNGDSMNGTNVDKSTRAIALFCESIRFKTINIALLDKGMINEEWQDSWSTLALNWAAITQNQFTIPVAEKTVCDYMNNTATPTLKTQFANSINKYLGTKACKL
uniref:Uncharacterized protein n=1 Tax=Bryopsis plumosa TaxID=3130 RepID=A0A0D6E228_BRYPL|nr:hypothetical protein [Bryopsis plumosa]CEO91040.1 hypothetical protein [Bryopsis plumosa]